MIKYLCLLINLLEQFVLKENYEIRKASSLSSEIYDKFKTDFQSVLSPEMKIQKGEEDEEIEIKPKPIDASTPLKKLEEFHETKKGNYLKTALKIYETD